MLPASRPLIGVTTSEVRRADKAHPTAEGDPKQREMVLGLKYLMAVERAGGIPVVLPPLALDAVPSLLDHLHGVCLSGGPDLAPEAYAHRPHPELGETEPELDVFEIALAQEADARGLPILGICRGAQALNVARGGTLHQHLPDVTDGTVEHRQSAASEERTHRVRIEARSALGRTLGCRTTEVNSFHHQAADALGADLRAVAFAPDGIVEAIEATDRPHVRGVQWHAECLVAHTLQLRLFEELVEAARSAPVVALRRAA